MGTEQLHAQAEDFQLALHKAQAGLSALAEKENADSGHADMDEDHVGQHHSDRQTPTDSWPVLDQAAYHGLVGEFVNAVAPHSEADPVGILIHTLTGAACQVGAGPRVLVEHTPHYARLNALLVGKTAGGRKGMAWSTPRFVFSKVDEQWALKRVKSGLSSGEGLIFQVRDPQYKLVPIKKTKRASLEEFAGTGDGQEFEEVLEDPGEEDKRLLIIESEFAGALKVMAREGNTLSPVMRDAWDHGNLSPLTKNNRIAATGAHICIIGHATQDELLRLLTATERGNGFANRFLFFLVRRQQFLPSGKGAPISVLEPYFVRFLRTLEKARTRGVLARDPEAEELWSRVYPKIEEEIPGLTGAILARAAAQALRLSLIYSLLDEREAEREDPAIRAPHLLAALAVWDYCKSSALRIFGDATGDPIADRLLRAIKSGPHTDTDLYEVLGKHQGDRNRKDHALDLLARLNRVHSMRTPTAGRYVREWHIGAAGGCALCAERG